MRKQLIFTALLATCVCPPLASYAGWTDATSEHSTLGSNQGGSERASQANMSSASSASFSHAGMYVDMPTAAADPVPAQPSDTTRTRPSVQVNREIKSQTNNYVWTN